jgi:hypothetical protein
MSNHEDRPLIGYIPAVLKEVRQYQALACGEQPEIFKLFNEIETALNNQFVLTSDEFGVGRWEKILNIMPKATYTLDERKFTILSRLAEKLPFSYRMLEQILTGLCGENGYRAEVNHGLYELAVKIALIAKNNFNDVETMLNRVVPANLTINLSLMYNTWGIARDFTWGALAAKAWGGIKEDALT